ncbi:unnamed protein product [Prorocentrum cordatum]|uniref:Uncharacterized protein n=1 Tax=Prorocentrum cordatum TaxID=2364126 RepID=A0ABN9R6U0_9DINO|nr:unnamed protein product [Polarella glacialis]
MGVLDEVSLAAGLGEELGGMALSDLQAATQTRVSIQLGGRQPGIGGSTSTGQLGLLLRLVRARLSPAVAARLKGCAAGAAGAVARARGRLAEDISGVIRARTFCWGSGPACSPAAVSTSLCFGRHRGQRRWRCSRRRGAAGSTLGALPPGPPVSPSCSSETYHRTRSSAGCWAGTLARCTEGRPILGCRRVRSYPRRCPRTLPRASCERQSSAAPRRRQPYS